MSISIQPHPSVSIVIPCRNEAGDIEGCLSSVLAQEAPRGGFEVIVADGISDDGTREILRRIETGESRVRMIDNPNRIASSGLNAAIKAARGEVIVRMDAHTEYAPDYVRQCIAVLQESGADNVGGPWVAKGARMVSRAVAAGFQSPFAVGGARSHAAHYEGSTDSVYLGCWRKEAFHRFGFFDEEFVRNQDDEHNLRINRGGGKVWQSPKIRSWYRPRGSLSALFRQYTQYGYWKVRVIQKHKLPAAARHLVPGAFVLALVLLALLSAFTFLTADSWALAPVLRPLPSVTLAVLLGIYSLCVLCASVVTAGKSEWKLLSVLPAVFVCYHFGYGWGFLRGVLDFVLLKRRPPNSFTQLTRDQDARISRV